MKQKQNWVVGELYRVVSMEARGDHSKNDFYGFYEKNGIDIGASHKIPINTIVLFLKTKEAHTGIRTYFLYKNKVYFTHFHVYLTFEKV